jgi:hypothetical protein
MRRHEMNQRVTVHQDRLSLETRQHPWRRGAGTEGTLAGGLKWAVKT